ncbi:hypothetical protein PR048_011270 [Dryococelus australis]|uniref:Reverse transcriptase domain-containing protein n=1 Tax=Dryococelus australis TaxID=614101 RepID=A0ABQ9HL60_9NEOP|nr:hypothetical protein PR048_011270 [Dryococelus australis]
MKRIKAPGIVQQKIQLITLIWEKEAIPEEWQESVICPIFNERRFHDVYKLQRYLSIRITEKCWEYNKEVHLLFIDFKKVYGNIQKSSMWIQMEKAGIPEKLIRLTRICVEGSKSRVKMKGNLSASFESGRDGNRPTNRQEMIEIKEVGLEINTEKTKYLPISRCHYVGPMMIDMNGDIPYYNTTVVLYGAEIWALTKRMENKLMAF